MRVLPPPVEFLDRLNLYKNAIPQDEAGYQSLLGELRVGVGKDQFKRIDYWLDNYSPSILGKMHERIDKITQEINDP